MGFLKHNILLAIVFITGACVLVIEISALRILSPYFGNTIYSTSSVIGVILAALSVGYYFGGRLADRYPYGQMFYGLIALSGVSVLFLNILILFLLPSLGSMLPILSGPLVASILLFFAPAVIMGALSPYAVVLQCKTNKKKGVGSVSGVVFFWSTLGSIFGSIFAGFVLIPHLGLNHIVSTVGTILVGIGLLGMILNGSKTRYVFLLLAMSIMLLSSIGSLTLTPDPTIVYSADGMYEKVFIFDQVHDGKKARFLVLDRNNSAAIYLESGEMVFEYTKMFVLYQVIQEDIGRALVIGGGGYSIPKGFLESDEDVIVDVVEIEPSLFDLSKKYFQVSTTSRLVNHVTDGRRFLVDTEHEYDVIFGDAFHSIHSIPSHLATQEFFQLSYDKLHEDGVLILNVIGSLSKDKPSLFWSIIATIQSVYPQVYLFAIDGAEHLEAQNIVVLATKSDEHVSFDGFEQSTSGDVLETINSVVVVTQSDTAGHRVFTDMYAPVDYYGLQALE